MAGRTPRDLVDDAIHDADMVVFRLEKPFADASAAERERVRVRRDLERIVQQLRDIADKLQ